jgi:hypothetical protein
VRGSANGEGQDITIATSHLIVEASAEQQRKKKSEENNEEGKLDEREASISSREKAGEIYRVLQQHQESRQTHGDHDLQEPYRE